ncbi:methyltransferase domain-containing protein [Adhaeribacter sp. BT258]|uniref:Methyltransferase domain-containing protein n=1 Tax=Adhaeribacter terrigena TaxID=2793070 RepID=A0ABS1BY94_9BACT|nr:class I SAM-dependent methyltransferase [Adhaeribacter terrigena]MBK0401872.1 methyltransferase domain-containing protein [Adhaeribacter terrigena]
MNSENKDHWETIYETKSPDEVSWTEEIPKTSLDYFHSFNLPKSAKIIDVGGGDSKLVDYLVAEGYENVSVLDISENALKRAQTRLGTKADLVNWIVADITDFKPDTEFDFWHDRAVFHFLTTPDQIAKYVQTATKAVKGFLVIGTFSEDGPKKCSGLEIKQYTEKSLPELFAAGFEMLDCHKADHTTPFNTIQNFVFCSLKKK